MPKTEAIFDAEQHGAPLPPDKASERLEREHAIKLGVQRLADLRSAGGGPPFIKPSERSVRYPTRLLDEWAAARNRGPLLTFVPLKDRRREVTEAEADEAVRKFEERRRAANADTAPVG